MSRTIWFCCALSAIIFCSCEKKNKESDNLRIVSLAPSISECLYFLDPSLKHLVACTTYDTAQSFSAIPKLSIYPPDVEGILASSPDCVMVLEGFNSPQLVTFLKEKGIKVYVQKASNIQELFHSLREMASIVNQGTQLENKIDSLEGLMSQLKETVNPQSLMAILSDQPLYIYGKNSYFDDMIKHLTGSSLIYPTDLNLSYPSINPEILLQLDPEKLVFTQNSIKDRLFSQMPALKQLKAYQNNQLLILDEDCLSRPSPRCVECLYKLRDCLRAFHD